MSQNPTRSPNIGVIAAVAIIGRNNNPLYLKTYVNDMTQKQFFHFVVHASLDVIEEKVKRREKDKYKPDKIEKYLSLLYPTEDYKIYGYHTNTQVKMILVVSESAFIKEIDIKIFFEKFYSIYLSATSNPFYETNSPITSASFEKEMTDLISKGL